MKTNLITAFALIALCVGVSGWQRSQLTDLREEISNRKSLPVAPKIQTSSLGSVESIPAEKDIGSRITATISRILTIQSESDNNEGPATFFLSLTRILEELRDFSSDELFVALKQLKEMESADHKVKKMFSTLLMVVADVEPERTLSFIETQLSDDDSSKSQMTRMAAFSAWAETNPQLAREFLAKQSWDDSELMNARKSLLEGYAKSSLTEALNYLEDSKIHPRMAGYTAMQIAQDPNRREEIWELLDNDIAPSLRNDVSGGLLSAILMESGLSGVDEALDGMKFASPQDRDHVLSGLTDLAFQATPKEAMNWALREFSPESQSQVITKGLRRWAGKDFAAAGNWLKEQAPSPNKNSAIAAYATTVAKLDPQSALAWADEITEKDSQDETRRDVLKQWHEAAPQAAAVWLDKKGLDREQWLPNDQGKLEPK